MLILSSDVLYKKTERATAAVLAFLFDRVDDSLSAGRSEFKFNFKAPKNSACKKDMSNYIDDGELEQLGTFYQERNRRLPALIGVVASKELSWLPSI